MRNRSREWTRGAQAILAVAAVGAGGRGLGQCEPAEVAKLTASDGGAGDFFGAAVAMSEDTVIIGARQHDHGGSNTGAAYIYDRNEGGVASWGEVTEVGGSDTVPGDRFAVAVGLSGDFAIVGAPDDDGAIGSAYIFRRDEGGTDNWGEVDKLLASDGAASDNFGEAVGISGDTAVSGAPGAGDGKAYIHQRDEGGPNNWGEVTTLEASDGAASDAFGLSVAIGGDTVIVGAPDHNSDAGAVYVYGRNEGGADNWGEVAKLVADDGVAGDDFGTWVAISGDVAVVGAPDAEAAYVYRRDEGGTDNWGQVSRLTADDGVVGDQFGRCVAMSGDTVVVGARFDDGSTGSIYIYRRNEGGTDAWGQVEKVVATDGATGDRYGARVAVDADRIICGASFEDSVASNAGAAYYVDVLCAEGEIDFGDPSEFASEDMPVFMDIGDFDNNGFLDAVVVIPDELPTMNGELQVFLNNGTDVDGTWLGYTVKDPFPVGMDPTGVAVGLFNVGNRLDLAVTSRNEDEVLIFFGDGLGGFGIQFPALMTGDGPNSVVAADFTEDGYVDIAVTIENPDPGQVEIWANDETGGFGSMPFVTFSSGGAGPHRVNSSDVDNDKCLDIIGANNQSADDGTVGSIFVAHYAGAGQWDPVVTYPIGADPRDLAVGRLDGDLFEDIVAVNAGDDDVSVLLNNTDGTFTVQGATIPVGMSPIAIDAADFDGDFDLDLAVVQIDTVAGESIQIVRNLLETGSLVWDTTLFIFEVDEGPDNTAPVYVRAVDVDLDGRNDLVTANLDGGKSGGSVSVLLNTGAATLFPTGYIVDGTVASGGLSDVYTDDDVYLALVMSASPIRDAPVTSVLGTVPVLRVEFTGTAQVLQPAELAVKVVSNTNAWPTQPTQRLLLRNFQLRAWELVDERPASSSDQTVDVVITSGAGRYVRRTAHEMRMRVEWFNPGGVVPINAWRARVDQAVWTITP